jgi:predicted nucleotidyltransferase
MSTSLDGLGTAYRGSTLAAVFPSPAMARLVVFFSVHPGARFHLRELLRRTKLASASLQRELSRLTALGVVRRERSQDGRVYFAADEQHDAWRGWALLIRSAVDPVEVLREVLVGAEGLEGAFVYGSTARGDRRPDSDVDLFLILRDGPQATEERKQLSEAEFLIGRPLDVTEYAVASAPDRSESPNAFLQRVVAEPKRWVYGNTDSLSAVRGS